MTIAELKIKLLEAAESADVSHGVAERPPGFMEAIEALPDLAKFAKVRMSSEIHAFLIRELESCTDYEKAK